MRYTTAVLVCLIIFCFFYPAVGQAKPGISADNAVLIEQTSGRTLFEKKADQERSIASITKIMTAIIAIESGQLNQDVTISQRAANASGSSLYLEEGEKMKLKDLVYGLLLRSGNDAAIAISEHIGGSVEGFSLLMNQKASWLGMTNTSFANPHGLEEEGHFSSAYDMALLMRYAMKNDQFQQITNTKSYKSSNRVNTWKNKHKLLTGKYEYATGGKTGFTKKAGRTLVTSAKKGDMALIAVTLKDPDDWKDHINLFDWGFSRFTMTTIEEKGKQSFRTDSGEYIEGYLHRDITLPLRTSEQRHIESESMIPDDPFLSENIVGRTIYTIGSNSITEASIHTDRDDINIINDIITVFERVAGIDAND